MKEEIKDKNGGKILLVCTIIGIVALIVFCKYAGTLESQVEKDGYCKLSYGDNFKFDKVKMDCYNESNSENRINFTKGKFREICPKNNFFSTRFLPYCFNYGESFS